MSEGGEQRFGDKVDPVESGRKGGLMAVSLAMAHCVQSAHAVGVNHGG